MMDKKSLVFLIVVSVIIFSSCSIKQLAIDSLTSSMSATGEPSPFLTEEDPEFAKQSLPFALKLYETLLQQDPQNTQLLLMLAQGFTSYSNAFVEAPAKRLEINEYDKQQKEFARAKAFYLRAYRYALKSMEIRHKGFSKAWDAQNLELAFENIDRDDVDYLYWLGTSLLAAIAIQPSDPAMSIKIPQAVGACTAVLRLNPYYSDGAIHEMFIRLYGSLDVSLWWRAIPQEDDIVRKWLVEYYRKNRMEGKSTRELIEFHFKQAITLDEGKKLSPYIAYAQAVMVPLQDREGYISILKKALEIDTEKYPEYRLENEVARETAIWLIKTVDDIFI
ncbi:TRAP transporter TatT component family protein [Spirochaetia bacterium 38H-sp]|uniref:TRAP transporter TatT component family protein n=1 Tax=Rarispira pelagica TaxID=3141764 RepID=A0ABU9UA06_9SPIR